MSSIELLGKEEEYPTFIILSPQGASQLVANALHERGIGYTFQPKRISTKNEESDSFVIFKQNAELNILEEMIKSLNDQQLLQSRHQK